MGETVTEAELVATALATGAAAALTDSTRGPVRELHAGLRDLLRRRLDGDCGYGLRVLNAYETDPDVWRNRLLRALNAAGAESDEEVLAAARAVLRAERLPRLVDVPALPAGREPVREPAGAHPEP
ncbi:hypothetical protein AB0F77_36775 [Streptomyces sp. NPDC026672]|uniref:hypothetical protein n=1 Tax=unclassified Streptomyces TaxID=2593676 RepID=UPI0033DD1178